MKELCVWLSGFTSFFVEIVKTEIIAVRAACRGFEETATPGVRGARALPANLEPRDEFEFVYYFLHA